MDYDIDHLQFSTSLYTPGTNVTRGETREVKSWVHDHNFIEHSSIVAHVATGVTRSSQTKASS